MARKKRKSHGLHGTPAEHSHELRKLAKELKTESAGAKRALSKGHCGAAIGRLLTAYHINGEASAHAQEAGEFLPKSVQKSFRSTGSAIMRKCVRAK